jgi:hypothetical protein
MVGSITTAVDTSTITSAPPGLKASQWFGFNAGYTPAPQIVPGKAYWVKSSGVGSFYFASGGPVPSVQPPAGPALADLLNSVTIRDSKGSSQTLYFGLDGQNAVKEEMYEMPPVPPAGAFDARFETKDGGSLVSKNGASMAIGIQSSAYPVDVTWNIRGGEYTISDAVGGMVIGAKAMRGTGSLRITNSGVTKLLISGSGGEMLPKEYALMQNYPNPFNPTTNIKFALPVSSRVGVEIYNLLGQKVRTLVSENLNAGYHVVEWNGVGSAGEAVGSGVYFVRFNAEGVNGKTFSDVRKIMLMK